MELLKRWLEKQSALSSSKLEFAKLADQISRTERDLFAVEKSLKETLKDGYYMVGDRLIRIHEGRPEILEVTK